MTPVAFSHGWPLTSDAWDVELKVYPGAPHRIARPYQQALDEDLLKFIS